VIRVALDLSPEGDFETQWLVATAERVLVVARNVVVAKIAVRDLAGVRTEALVGGGCLELRRTDGPPLRLLYSSSLVETVGEVARGLEELRQGRTVAVPTAPRVRCDRCGRRLPEPGGVCPTCIRRFTVLRRVLAFAAPYRRRALLLAVAAGSTTLVSLLPPLVTRRIIDDALGASATVQAGAEARLTQLTVFVLGLLLIQLGTWAAEWTQGWNVTWVGARLTADIRAVLYQHLGRLPLRIHDRSPSGSLMARMTSDASALEHFLIRGLPQLAIRGLTLVGVFVVMARMDVGLALIVAIPVPIVWLWSHVFWRWMSPILRRASQAAAAFSAGLGENLAGIRVVKAFGRETVMAEKFERSNSQLLRRNAELHRTRAVLMATTALLTNVGILALWWWGGSGVVRGDLSLGTLLAFYGYASLFYGPLQWFGQLTSWMTQAVVGAQRIFEVLDRPSEPYEEAGAERLGQVAGRVAFRGVSFGYEAGKPVLQEVDFEVTPGEVVGVVGRSGSGKTTAMQLLCRFYEVGAGAIEVDGVDIRRIRLADLRAQIGVVLQESFLFSGTIAENIGYGRPGAGFEEIVRAAKAAAAHEFIVRKADGYDTEVGERGQRLSGGERQRIAIARALLRDPAILILDEATSSVDVESERRIQEALREARGRTTFIIAHRWSTVNQADRLIVLDNGRLVATGTPEAVLAGGQAFSKLLDQPQRRPAPPSEARAVGAGPRDVATRLNLLEPTSTALLREASGSLGLMLDDRSYTDVAVLRAAPLSDPDRYVVFLGESEIGVLRDPTKLDPWSRGVLADELRRCNLTAVIRRIDRLAHEADLSYLSVLTDRGPRDFAIRSAEENARWLGQRHVLFVDIDGNRFDIPNVEALDERSAMLLRQAL
jgi:ATP-binding cassette subfamily B protein